MSFPRPYSRSRLIAGSNSRVKFLTSAASAAEGRAERSERETLRLRPGDTDVGQILSVPLGPGTPTVVSRPQGTGPGAWRARVPTSETMASRTDPRFVR